MSKEDSPEGKEKAVAVKKRGLTPVLGGVVALAGVAATALFALQDEIRLVEMRVDRMMEITSINEGLEQAGALDMIMPLTFSDGDLDLLYAGAPECSHCQRFMDAGFEAMIAFAEEKDLDFGYMPMAMTAYGVSIAAVEKCALPGATAPAHEMVRQSYAIMDELKSAVKKAQAEMDEGASREAAMARVQGVMKSLHDQSGNEENFNEACYSEKAQDIGDVMRAFSERFSLSGTPTFYFVSAEGEVFRTVGEPDLAVLGEKMRENSANSLISGHRNP